MDNILNVMSVMSIALMLLVLVSVRRAHIRVEYSVAWLTASALLLIASRSETVLQGLANLLQVSSPPFALLLFAMFIFLFVFYRFSVRISDLKDANIALAQRLAILEYQLRQRHEEHQSPSSKGSPEAR